MGGTHPREGSSSAGRYGRAAVPRVPYALTRDPGGKALQLGGNAGRFQASAGRTIPRSPATPTMGSTPPFVPSRGQPRQLHKHNRTAARAHHGQRHHCRPWPRRGRSEVDQIGRPPVRNRCVTPAEALLRTLIISRENTGFLVPPLTLTLSPKVGERIAGLLKRQHRTVGK